MVLQFLDLEGHISPTFYIIDITKASVITALTGGNRLSAGEKWSNLSMYTGGPHGITKT